LEETKRHSEASIRDNDEGLNMNILYLDGGEAVREEKVELEKFVGKIQDEIDYLEELNKPFVIELED
jgi:hypothetical protein